jgi:type VI secretion system Hcp family effector
MAIHISISAPGRSLDSKGSRLHAMGYGTTAITPRNLNQMLSQMQGESTGNMGKTIGKHHHKPLTITREVGPASPQLFDAPWKQEVLSSVVLNIVGRPDTGAGEKVYSRITLTNATISKVKGYTPLPRPKHGSSGEHIHTNELEQVELTFQRITFANAGGSTTGTDDWTTSG